MIGLTQEQLKIVKDILQKHVPKQTVWAFGSRVKGTAKPYSDLDLCILGKPLSFHEMSLFREAFSESNLPFRVDIIQWEEISEEFQTVIKEAYVALQNN